MACYYLKGVAGRGISLNTIFAGAMPYLVLIFISMLLLYVFPGIATWLPAYLYDPR
jgi:TRAP-type mannitol/chloroaromatic compound transport system permease large subunit